MGYKIDISPKAESDLGEILSYIIDKLQNPIAASALADAIEAAYTVLETMLFIYE